MHKILDNNMYFFDYDTNSREGFVHIMNNIIENGHFFSRKNMYAIAQNLHFVLTMDDDYKKRAVENTLQTLREKCVMLDTKRELLKIEMSKKIPQYFIDTDIPHVRPIERHVRGLDDEQYENNHQNVLNIMYNLVMNRELVRKIHRYLYLYVYELTIKMHYVKSQLFKLEFANQFSPSGYVRKGLHTGTALDSIIYYYMDMYMELDKEFRHYGKEMYFYNVDCVVEDLNYRYRNGNIILQNYYGIPFDYGVGLPASVYAERRRKQQDRLLRGEI